MKRVIHTALACCTVLSGCTQTLSQTETTGGPAERTAVADKTVGETRWVSSSRPVSVCRIPHTGPLSQIDKDCFVLRSGSFTVEAASADGRYGIYKNYTVRLPDGRSGFVKDFDVIMSDSQAEHQRKVAAKADCDRRGGVRIGMTAEQVRASCWGKPQKVNATHTAGGDHEQWVYPGYQYVYVRNGIVTSIQTSR